MQHDVKPEPDGAQVATLGDSEQEVRVRQLTREARRFAAEAVAQHSHGTYDDIVELVAWAYAKGRLEGYTLARDDVRPLTEAVEEVVRR